MTACATNVELAMMLNGQVSKSQLIRLRAHIADCGRCQQVLEQLTEHAEMPSVREQSPTRAAIDREPALLRQMVALKHLNPTREVTLTGLTGIDKVLEPPLQDGDLGSIGTYRILDELGRGGMGVVFLGFDEELQRRVAIKVLRPDCLSPSTRVRFLREARAAAALQHKNVVPVYEVSESAAEIPYLVMPVVHGETVRRRIEAHGPLPPLAAARITLHVCDGLHAAHQAGIVHRDIKPDNIIVDRSGTAQIMDFGLVRDANDELSVTVEGVIPGTPAYMSPEQILSPTSVGPASDVYSLGTTLFEMLTGRPAFEGRPQSVVGQVISAGIPEPRSCQARIPQGLNAICVRATHQDPQSRYPSARALADDLRSWIREQPVKQSSGPGRGRFRLARLKSPGAGVTTISLCVLVMLVVAFRVSQNSIPDHDATPAGTGTRSASVKNPGLTSDRAEGHGAQRPKPAQETDSRQPAITDRDRLHMDQPAAAVAQKSDSAVSRADTQRLDQVRQGLEARIDQGADTPDVRLELARVRIDLASNLRMARQPLRASEMLQSAARAVREINPRGDGVSDSRFVSSLAAVHFAIGQEYHKIDKLGYARESSERSRVLWKQAVAAKPGNTQYRARLLATDQALQQIEREAARRSQQDGVR